MKGRGFYIQEDRKSKRETDKHGERKGEEREDREIGNSTEKKWRGYRERRDTGRSIERQ